MSEVHKAIDMLQLKSWYDRIYWSEAPNLRPYHTYLPFIEYLEAQLGRRLLDIGCGGATAEGSTKAGIARLWFGPLLERGVAGPIVCTWGESCCGQR